MHNFHELNHGKMFQLNYSVVVLQGYAEWLFEGCHQGWTVYF